MNSNNNNKIMKHLNIRIMLAIVATMTSVKVSSFTVENKDGIGIEYDYNGDGNGVEIVGISSLPSSIALGEYYELNIPESIIYNENEYSVIKMRINVKNVGDAVSFISKMYIPQSIKSISGRFPESLKTLIFENISDITYTTSYMFWSCKLENVIVKHLSDDSYREFGGPYSSNQTDVYSENTYKHANLFVPVGTWADFAYTTNIIPGWSNFIHIREMSMDTEELSESRAYTLLDTKNFNYYVYDVVNNRITLRGSHSNFDESSPYNCWQIIKIDNGFALYNIGAKRYATLTTNGELELSIVPSIMPMENASNGITVGNSQFGFVLNENVSIDQSVTSIGKRVIYENSIVKYYTIDGRSSDIPHKGLNIIRMNNGETKKILVK